MPDPRVILVQPGLPDVAAGPVERFLRANRGVLEGAGGLGLLLPGALTDAARAARHFGRHGQALALSDLVEALEAEVAPRLAAGGGRDAVIACDALSGAPPGLLGVADWSAAAPLGAVLTGWLAERFPASQVRLVYVTRADWRHRAWLRALATGQTREDEAAFAAALDGIDPAGAMTDVAEAVAEASGDRAEAFVMQHEDGAAHPQGTGGAAMELLDLPEAVRAALVPPGPERAPDAALAQALLEIARAGLRPREARAARETILEEAGLAGWG